MPEMNRRELLIAASAVAACACVGCMTGTAEAAEDTSTTVDVGPVADYTGGPVDKFAKANGIMMVRDGDKVYAASGVCTHKKCTLKLVDKEFRCPCHGSRFTTVGIATKGPATVSLPRYAITKDDKGHLIVDKTKQFDDKHYDDAASYVVVK